MRELASSRFSGNRQPLLAHPQRRRLIPPCGPPTAFDLKPADTRHYEPLLNFCSGRPARSSGSRPHGTSPTRGKAITMSGILRCSGRAGSAKARTERLYGCGAHAPVDSGITPPATWQYSTAADTPIRPTNRPGRSEQKATGALQGATSLFWALRGRLKREWGADRATRRREVLRVAVKSDFDSSRLAVPCLQLKLPVRAACPSHP